MALFLWKKRVLKKRIFFLFLKKISFFTGFQHFLDTFSRFFRVFSCFVPFCIFWTRGKIQKRKKWSKTVFFVCIFVCFFCKKRVFLRFFVFFFKKLFFLDFFLKKIKPQNVPIQKKCKKQKNLFFFTLFFSCFFASFCSKNTRFPSGSPFKGSDF